MGFCCDFTTRTEKLLSSVIFTVGVLVVFFLGVIFA